jgi:hypothetical protein
MITLKQDMTSGNTKAEEKKIRYVRVHERNFANEYFWLTYTDTADIRELEKHYNLTQLYDARIRRDTTGGRRENEQPWNRPDYPVPSIREYLAADPDGKVANEKG